MARIRTVKPEFWTDERLTECSLSARLMFIGMFNFADDNGNMAYSAKRLKMQIFPADNIDTQPLLDDLITHGLLIEYSVNVEKFLNIKGFFKHQLINRPSPSKIPTPEFSDDSVRTHGAFIDGEEGNGKEGKVRERKGWDKEKEASPVADAPPAVKPEKPSYSAVEIPNWMPAEEWADFLKLRRAMGKSIPFTDAAMKAIVKKLGQLREIGNHPALVLEQAVRNGHRDVFAIKSDHANRLIPPASSFRQTNNDRRADFAAGMSGKSNPKGSNDDFIDAESRVVG